MVTTDPGNIPEPRADTVALPHVFSAGQVPAPCIRAALEQQQPWRGRTTD